MMFILLGIELIVSSALSIAQLDLQAALAGFLLSVSVSFLLVASSLVVEHLFMISLHMTQKEFVARQESANLLFCPPIFLPAQSPGSCE